MHSARQPESLSRIKSETYSVYEIFAYMNSDIDKSSFQLLCFECEGFARKTRNPLNIKF